MGTLARQGVQVERERGRKGLAFTGAHLGDLALMQGHAAHQLHVEVAHLEHAPAGLAGHGESFRQDVLQGGAIR